MFEPGSKKSSIKFSIKPENKPSKVCIAGDFNQWKPQAMKKQKDESFALTLNLQPGTYEYKFIIDDQWVVDPDNSVWAMNSYGTLNSVAQV